MKYPEKNVLARILALLMGATRTKSVAQWSGYGCDCTHYGVHAGHSDRGTRQSIFMGNANHPSEFDYDEATGARGLVDPRLCGA